MSSTSNLVLRNVSFHIFCRTSPVSTVPIGSIQIHTTGSKHCWLKVSFVLLASVSGWRTRLSDSSDLGFFPPLLRFAGLVHQLLHFCVLPWIRAVSDTGLWHSSDITLMTVFCQGFFFFFFFLSMPFFMPLWQRRFLVFLKKKSCLCLSFDYLNPWSLWCELHILLCYSPGWMMYKGWFASLNNVLKQNKTWSQLF